MPGTSGSSTLATGTIVGIVAAVGMVAIFATAGVVLAKKKKKRNRSTNKVVSVSVRPVDSKGDTVPIVKQAWSA